MTDPRPDSTTPCTTKGCSRTTPLADDSHWAFGTSFEDPLAGVDTTIPPASTPTSSRRTA